MKHLIIGSGTIGYATGVWLEANKEEVYFFDIKMEIVAKLREQKKKIVDSISGNYDIYWVCTAEWNVETVLKSLNPRGNMVVIRSTTPTGSVKKWSESYMVDRMFHVPEFLRANTSLDDVFNPDRIVIGTTKDKGTELYEFFKKLFPSTPVVVTDSNTSETIKLVSNSWLATQISFWNEVKKLCDKLNINPQMVAECCCLDKRISKYGAKMLGSSFAGFCLPKDLVSLRKLFKENGVDSYLIDGVCKVNECM